MVRLVEYTRRSREDTMNFERSRELQARLAGSCPGGCHTYAKGPDQYPELSPALIARGAAATCGTSTATSSSSTAWGCGR